MSEAFLDLASIAHHQPYKFSIHLTASTSLKIPPHLAWPGPKIQTDFQRGGKPERTCQRWRGVSGLRITPGDGIFMWPQPLLWHTTTERCLLGILGPSPRGNLRTKEEVISSKSIKKTQFEENCVILRPRRRLGHKKGNFFGIFYPDGRFQNQFSTAEDKVAA